MSSVIVSGSNLYRIETPTITKFGSGYILTSVTYPINFINPVISSFSPKFGIPGELISISGSGFLNTSTVTIGGVSFENIQILSDSLLKVTIPDLVTTNKILVNSSESIEELLILGSIVTLDSLEDIPSLSILGNLELVAAPIISLTLGTGFTFTGNNIDIDFTGYATQAELGTKQDTLVSGTNIKTINGDTLLGNGNLALLKIKSKNIESINITKTLTLLSEYWQFLNPAVSSVIVKLPLITSGDYFEGEILNAGSGVNALVIQENDGTSIITLSSGTSNKVQSIYYYWDTTQWRVFEKTYFA